MPAHASILISLLPEHHGVSVSRQTGLPDEVTTLAEVLRERGYATASFNGGMQLDPVYRLDQGLDLYESVRPKSASTEDHRQPEALLEDGRRRVDWIPELAPGVRLPLLTDQAVPEEALAVFAPPGAFEVHVVGR